MNIQFSNVSCTLDHRNIIEDLTLSFEERGIYTFIGKNGSGKSTFFSLLSGLTEPNQGSITIDGKPIHEHEEFRNTLVYLTNDMHLETNETINSIVDRFKRYGKGHFQPKLFHSLLTDFNVDPRTKLSTLSTGEKKIHFFIAHMAFNPKTILIDEFLDGIDVIHHKLFTQYLYQACDTHDAKVFIISHHAHDIYMLSDTIFLTQNKSIRPIGNIENIIAKYTAMQVSTDETILDQLQLAGIELIHFEQFGKIATITYKTTPDAALFWQTHPFQYCEQTTIPIERVIEYEFIN